MNKLETLLADLSDIKGHIKGASAALEALTEQENSVRGELSAYMIDNEVSVATSPDQLWRARLGQRTTTTLTKRPELIAYLLDAKRYLLSPDLVAVKKELKNDPEIADCFTISNDVRLTVSEIKEEVQMEESMADFRERVRAGSPL